MRTYEFLSQIVHFDDRELEQLSVYGRHLHPLLRVDRLDEDAIDVSELELTHYRLTKRAEHQLRLEEEQGDYGLKPVSEVGLGKPHDPEKQRLAEIIDKLNDLYGAEVSDDNKLHFFRGVAGRLVRDTSLMAQLSPHSEDQAMHDVLPKRFSEAIMDTMTDNEKLAMPLLEDDEIAAKDCRIIYQMLVNNRTGTQK